MYNAAAHYPEPATQPVNLSCELVSSIVWRISLPGSVVYSMCPHPTSCEKNPYPSQTQEEC